MFADFDNFRSFDQFQKTHNIVQYDDVIQLTLPEYHYCPCVLANMVDAEYTTWNMDLPEIHKSEKLILHTQDHLNVRQGGVLPEINAIEDFYEGHDLSNIVVIHWNHRLNELYNGKINLIEFPTYVFDSVQVSMHRKSEWENEIYNRTNKYDFICLNGKARTHRMNVCDYLDTLSNTYKITRGWADDYEHAPYNDHNYNDTDNFIKLIELYNGSNINIVTETMYDESHGVITEKTLNAFAAMQLPIVIGYTGIIDDIRNYGFDVFDDIIDHSYDIMDNDVRWRMAIDLNKHLFNGDYNYNELMPRLKKNQEYLINGYPSKIIENFNHQVSEMYLRMC
jgi:hypothetical protein